MLTISKWFWVVSILGGASLYLLARFFNRGPMRRPGTNNPAMIGGAVAVAIGIRSAAWAASLATAVSGGATISLGLWLIICGLSSLLTGLLSGSALLLDGAYGNLPRYRAKDKFLVAVFPTIMVACLLVAPLFKVPAGSLVAENGKILSFGSGYHFRPFLLPTKVGLNNPAAASVTKHVNSKFFGKRDLGFSGEISLILKPGDKVPTDFYWYAFQGALNEWFAQRLDNRFTPEPIEGSCKQLGITFRTCFILSRSLGTQETGVVMGIPVTWDGRYSFQER